MEVNYLGIFESKMIGGAFVETVIADEKVLVSLILKAIICRPDGFEISTIMSNSECHDGLLWENKKGPMTRKKLDQLITKCASQ